MECKKCGEWNPCPSCNYMICEYCGNELVVEGGD